MEVNGRISLTTEFWTSKSQTYFMAITVHWIDSEFNLRSMLLSFQPSDGSHSAEWILDIFFRKSKKKEPRQSSIHLRISSRREYFIRIIPWKSWKLSRAGFWKVHQRYQKPHSWRDSKENKRNHIEANSLPQKVLIINQIKFHKKGNIGWFTTEVRSRGNSPHHWRSTQMELHVPYDCLEFLTRLWLLLCRHASFT